MHIDLLSKDWTENCHKKTSETLVDPSNALNHISPKPTGVTEIGTQMILV